MVAGTVAIPGFYPGLFILKSFGLFRTTKYLPANYILLSKFVTADIIMADVHSKATRSYNMSRIKGKDTKPEMLVRKLPFTTSMQKIKYETIRN